MHFRKRKTLIKYNDYLKSKAQRKPQCDFCVEIPDNKKDSYHHWKIIRNRFPYDKIVERHDLLIPKRHIKKEAEMSEEEREELLHLKNGVLCRTKIYDFILENFPHMKSIGHYHLHLMRARRTKDDNLHEK